MSQKNQPRISYHTMCILAILVGAAGGLLQFMPGFEFFSFFLALPVLGGLIGAKNDYAEPDRRRLTRSFQTAFEGLMLIVLCAFAVVELPNWLPTLQGMAGFINSHWPGLIMSCMCALMGMAGLLKDPGASTV